MAGVRVQAGSELLDGGPPPIRQGRDGSAAVLESLPDHAFAHAHGQVAQGRGTEPFHERQGPDGAHMQHLCPLGIHPQPLHPLLSVQVPEVQREVPQLLGAEGLARGGALGQLFQRS